MTRPGETEAETTVTTLETDLAADLADADRRVQDAMTVVNRQKEERGNASLVDRAAVAELADAIAARDVVRRRPPVRGLADRLRDGDRLTAADAAAAEAAVQQATAAADAARRAAPSPVTADWLTRFTAEHGLAVEAAQVQAAQVRARLAAQEQDDDRWRQLDVDHADELAAVAGQLDGSRQAALDALAQLERAVEAAHDAVGAHRQNVIAAGQALAAEGFAVPASNPDRRRTGAVVHGSIPAVVLDGEVTVAPTAPVPYVLAAVAAALHRAGGASYQGITRHLDQHAQVYDIRTGRQNALTRPETGR